MLNSNFNGPDALMDVQERCESTTELRQEQAIERAHGINPESPEEQKRSEKQELQGIARNAENVENKAGTRSAGESPNFLAMTQFEVINAIYDSKILSKMKLTAGAKLVLIALARHFNPLKDEVFPSYKCISEHTGISKKSVERGVKELTAAGLVSYETRKVNRYKFSRFFFDSVNLSRDVRQNVCSDRRQNVAQTNKKEKINKKEENFKNFSFENAEEQNPENSQQECLSGNDFQVDYRKYSESKVYENFLAGGQNRRQNDVSDGLSYYERRCEAMQSGQNAGKTSGYGGYGYNGAAKSQQGRAAQAGQQPQNLSDGGSSRVLSAEESQIYIANLRAARENSRSPLDFGPEEAAKWYKELSPLLLESSMAKKIAAKYGLKPTPEAAELWRKFQERIR